MFPPSESYPGLRGFPEHRVLPRPAGSDRTLPAQGRGAVGGASAETQLWPRWGLKDTEHHRCH